MDASDGVIIKPTTTFSVTGGMSRFEERVLRELNELKSAQKKSEEQRILFEMRIEKKLQGHSGSNPNRPIQNRARSPPLEERVPFDGDDFEEFDQDFPIKKSTSVEELEWNIRTDLEYKFRLVIELLFSIFLYFS